MSLLRIVLVLSVTFGVAFTAECPSYWTSHGGYCYRLFGAPQTWQHAEGRCTGFTSTSGQTAHLVSIHDSSENAFVKSLVESTYGTDNGRYWIGLNELQLPGQYRWSDTSVYNYQGWLSGEPNSASEHCVEIWKTNRVGWNDSLCGQTKKVICKMPK